MKFEKLSGSSYCLNSDKLCERSFNCSATVGNPDKRTRDLYPKSRRFVHGDWMLKGFKAGVKGLFGAYE